MNDDRMESILARSLLGDSVPMKVLRATIARVAASSLNILIEGPTGSGKELVARAIHEASGRAGPLVASNVCAIADTMFEDAMFGHVRGAFTGAICDTRGYVAEAHHGTLFLDEISGLSVNSQAKLLRTIETHQFRPVGGSVDRRSDFRLVVATNVNLAHLEQHGQFRADLRYRVAQLIMRVPSLHERLTDVPLLAAHFLSGCEGIAAKRFSDSALRALQDHDWPGNVRELLNVVECAAVLSPSEVIGRDTVVTALESRTQGANRIGTRRDFLLRRTISVLEQAGWNVDQAAALLGVNPTTVYRRLKRARVRRSSIISADGAASESLSDELHFLAPGLRTHTPENASVPSYQTAK